MSRIPSTVDVKKRDECDKKTAISEPKRLFLYSVIAFVVPILLSRLFMTMELAGLIDPMPIMIFGLHMHHWAWGVFALSILVPLAYHFRNDGNTFAVLVIAISIALGLFVDGIFYTNSNIF